MKPTQDMFQEKLTRIKTAVALGKPDRVPVIPSATSFCAMHMDVKLSEFSLDPLLAGRTMLTSLTSLGDIDGTQLQTFYVHILSGLWYSKVKIPGYDLPENTLWQVAEEELMRVEDYDAIINGGFDAWSQDFFANRLDNLGEKMQAMSVAGQCVQDFVDAGVVPFAVGAGPSMPFEVFCGARTLTAFIKDLFRMPDKVQAAMDVAMLDIIPGIKKTCALMKPMAIWVGGWRSSGTTVAPRLWRRFVWPYYKRMVEEVIANDVIPVLHLDSNWERDLAFFRELPKGKCVFSPDGSTNLYKVKEILGDHMCIMGDVPAALLTLSTPDEVYKYCSKLIKEIGPSGYIMSQGCEIPPNAKPENVAAMISACTGK